jgi:hypothetical protein
VSIPLFICLNIMHCIIKYNTVHEWMNEWVSD